MRRSGPVLLAGALALLVGCARKKATGPGAPLSTNPAISDAAGFRATPVRPPRPALVTLDPGEVYVYDDKSNGATKTVDVQARATGLLAVDLGDGWAPFIFQDGGVEMGDTVKPNDYRRTFIDLANDRINADGRKMGRGEHNFIEPFGIPPTLSVLRARVEDDLRPDRQACEEKVDVEGMRAFTGNTGYSDRDHARRDHAEALRDAAWLDGEIARREAALAAPVPPSDAGVSGAGAVLPAPAPVATIVVRAPPGQLLAPTPRATWKPGDRIAAIAALRGDPNPKVRARSERAVRGQDRLRAVRALQARLICEGLLSTRSRFTGGMFDLPTHEALADWERKNDIFGWASLGGDTLAALTRPALDLDFDTFRRVLAERLADSAGIVEDGSATKGKNPPCYQDGDGRQGTKADQSGGDNAASATRHLVPNLIDDHLKSLLASLHVDTPADMVDFLRQHGPGGLTTLRVAFLPPPLPPYYGPVMDLSVEIDRGDVWYDFPFDSRGHAVQQTRDHFPHLTLFVNWHRQKIPLCRWRTTIGSWRSEVHANGKVYYKYKNSDVGPRVWKNIVAGPVWIPPDATPAKDLLTRKVLDRDKGPEIVVNTDVMGPGFQSAYGLVMAIHIDRRGFDNQIRTHGSVDYTSIARRFSHGCHRLVNDRAVRMFDFVLRRQPFQRIGTVPLFLKRKLVVDEKNYTFQLKTRGYYYELAHPISVTVGEGRIMGQVKKPISAYVRKMGVDYSDVTDIANAANPSGAASPLNLATPDSAASIGKSSEPAPESTPTIGP